MKLSYIRKIIPDQAQSLNILPNEHFSFSLKCTMQNKIGGEIGNSDQYHFKNQKTIISSLSVTESLANGTLP